MPTHPVQPAAQQTTASTRAGCFIRRGFRIPAITHLATVALLFLLALSSIPVSADPPIANDDYYTVQEDSLYNRIDVLDNDTPADTWPIVAVTQGMHGTVIRIEGNTRVSYTPDGNFFGADEFTYTVDDGSGGTATARVFVTVNGVNDPPTMVDDEAHTNEGASVTIDVLDNDTDIDGNLDPATVERISGPTHGTASALPDGRIRYVPTQYWNGTDTLTYSACDDGTPTPAKCGIATVRITVNPVADHPIADAGENQSVFTLALVTLDGSGSYDPDDPNREEELIYFWEQVDGPVRVNLSSQAAQSPTFIAPDDPCTLTFMLQVFDGEGLASAKDETVVTVKNQAPIADAGPDRRVPTGALVTLNGTGSSDPDHDALNYFWQQIGEPKVTLSDPYVPSPTFIAPGKPAVLTFSLRVTDAYGGQATPGQVQITVYEPPVFYAYMPFVTNNYAVGPDLIVQSIQATRNNVRLVIKNQGNAPVQDSFWVDVYINPRIVPTGVNQPYWWWDPKNAQGMAWWVSGQALAALTPGGSITLDRYSSYYADSESNVSWPLPVGTVLYAQVDSYNLTNVHNGVHYGEVLETHEMRNGTYNNILGPVSSTAALSSQPLAHHLTESDWNVGVSSERMKPAPDALRPRP